VKENEAGKQRGKEKAKALNAETRRTQRKSGENKAENDIRDEVNGAPTGMSVLLKAMHGAAKNLFDAQSLGWFDAAGAEGWEPAGY
jgi:hypothetical protein